MKWLSRDTVRLPYMTLCLSQAEFLKVATRCNVPDPGVWMDVDRQLAVVHTWENDSGLFCVVCLNQSAAEADPIAVACALVHESVHVFQRLCDSIGKEKPSREFEAYSIERISEALMREYARRVCT